MKAFSKLLTLAVLVVVIGCAAKQGPVTEGSGKVKPDKVADNLLTKVMVDSNQSELQVILKGKEKPTFNVFRLTDPQRLVVDIADCSRGDIPPVMEVNNELIGNITTNEYSDGEKLLTRVLIGFNHDADYWVTEQEPDVIVHVKLPDGITLRGSEEAASETVATQEVAPISEPEVVSQNEATPPQQCNGDEPIILQEAEGPGSMKIRNHKIVKLENGIRFDIASKGKTASENIGVMRLCNPDRLVIDLYGAKHLKNKHRRYDGDGTYVSKVRMSQHKDKLRYVLDLKQSRPEFSIDSAKSGVKLAFNELKPTQTIVKEPVIAQSKEPEVVEASPEPTPVVAEADVEKTTEEPKIEAVEEEKPIVVAEEKKPVVPEEELLEKVASRQSMAAAQIKRLDFTHKGATSVIEIQLDKTADYRLREGASGQVVMDLSDASLPEELEQSIDTSEFNGAISMVSFFNAEQGTKVVVQTRENTKNAIRVDGSNLYWEFDNPKSVAELGGVEEGHISVDAEGNTVMEYAPSETAGMIGAITSSGDVITDRRSTAQRISLELKDTDISDVLRLIADVSRLNIITSDNVKGRVTVRLLNVPWDKALSVILRTKQLGQERDGNIIRVATLKELETESQQRILSEQMKRELEPLSVRLIPVSYSTADDMTKKVQGLLSDRGMASFDERTNVVIVKDVEEVLKKAEDLVSKLDLQTPQVSIEAKIVEMEVQESRGFGIQWGGYFTMSEATGNPTGLAFPSSFGVAGAVDQRTAPGVPSAYAPPNYVVNVPHPTPTTGIGFNFGNVTNSFNLSLRLTAAEASGKLRIISSPKVTTLDNTEAKIKQGLKIPLIVVNITGVRSTKMVNAELEMVVQPHITADGSIIMKLRIKKEEPDYSRTNELGDPAIISKEAETEVLVRTGETTVIGGIYTRRLTELSAGVPYLMDIPVLGWLFKSGSSTMEKTELLIFLTPRIVNRSQSTLVEQ